MSVQLGAGSIASASRSPPGGDGDGDGVQFIPGTFSDKRGKVAIKYRSAVLNSSFTLRGMNYSLCFIPFVLFHFILLSPSAF